MWSECASSINSAACSDVGCTKFTDVWPDCSRYKHSDSFADAACNNVTDMCSHCLCLLLYDSLHKIKASTYGTVSSNQKGIPKFTKKLQMVQRIRTYTQHDGHQVVGSKGCLRANHTTQGHDETNSKNWQTDKATPTEFSVCPWLNKNMGAVDQTDIMFNSIYCVRNWLKWYRKYFPHLLNITLLYSRTLYKFKTGQNISLANF
jgi:hypothetical protein